MIAPIQKIKSFFKTPLGCMGGHPAHEPQSSLSPEERDRLAWLIREETRLCGLRRQLLEERLEIEDTVPQTICQEVYLNHRDSQLRQQEALLKMRTEELKRESNELYRRDGSLSSRVS